MVAKHGGAVFVCELIRETDLLKKKKRKERKTLTALLSRESN